MKRLVVLMAWIMGVLGAAAAEAPLPNNDPVPVYANEAAAAAALEAARAAGVALTGDLGLGMGGALVTAPTALPLPPGRYRLHALASVAPHDNILSEATALRLSAGGRRAVFERKTAFPIAGTVAPVHLDFVMSTAGVATVSAEWLVGDSHLDRGAFRTEEEARRAYFARRQNALNQLALKGRTETGMGGAEEDDLGDLKDLVVAGKPRLKALPLAGKDLPTYRIMLAGLGVETLSPVAVEGVETDRAAYEAGAGGQVLAALRNVSDKPATVRLELTVADAERADAKPVPLIENVTLEPGEAKRVALAAPLKTEGVRRRGRVRVEAAVAGLRPSAGQALFVIRPSVKAVPADREKKVFAHYMGCYPAGTGATRHHLLNLGEELKHETSDETVRRGGRFRNFDLVPYGKGLTAEESADLEIRRAMRIGIDGFAVDAWAGGEGAKKTFDTLIAVAEKKDYPFTITVCIDPTCGGDLVGTVKEVLAKHGRSPKLARRDGKPLIFGYMSWCFGMGEMASAVDGALAGGERKAALDRLRTGELGWHLMGQAFARAEEKVGEPVFYTACMTYFFHEVDKGLVTTGLFSRAAGILGAYVGGVGGFGAAGFGYGDSQEAVAAAVKAAGGEWVGIGGMHQKENLPYEVYMPKGTEWFRGMWEGLIRNDATLPQLVTWNDYTENTAIAPAYNTRYTIYDLTGYYISWWKNGKPPAVERDRVYLTYAKYPKEAKSWPFAVSVRPERALEVLTILTAPATVKLPGREVSYEAPAGLHVQQFPGTPGPVVAELERGGATVLRLESPEPVTDRPFREDSALVCNSTEFDRLWKEDFGSVPPLLYSEYGDNDKDGLPNWFEMYWFSKERKFEPVAGDDAEALIEGPEKHPVTKWLDLSTAVLVDPAADPDRDGKSNLQEYLDRTDPTVPAPPR